MIALSHFVASEYACQEKRVCILQVSRKSLAVSVTSSPLPGSPMASTGPPPLVPASEAAADQKSQPALAGLGSSSWMSAESKPEQSHSTSELLVYKFSPKLFRLEYSFVMGLVGWYSESS